LESIFDGFKFDELQNQRNNIYGMTNVNARQFDPSATAVQMLSRKYSKDVSGEKIFL
jgi:hypothetical protein